VVVDLVMGAVAVGLGLALIGFSAPLADLMKEGDERYRGHPWVEAFEPDQPWLETDSGRWWILRSWLLLSAAGFVAIGALLLLRAL